MKKSSWLLKLLGEIIIIGVSLGLVIGIAGLVTGYFILGFMWLTA